MLFARIAAVVVGFPLVPVLFGWCVLGRVPGLDRAERFTAAFGVGYAVLAAAEFLAFVSGAPQPWFQLAVIALLLAAAVVCRRGAVAQAPSSPEFWPLVGGCALAYVHLLCVQAQLPQYVGSDWWGDWHMHYQEAQVFLGKFGVETQWSGAGTYTLASRTPLFNLAAAFLLSVTGDDFWAFQVAASALSCCWVPAVYLLLRDLFGVRAARLTLVLAPFNLWLLHNSWFTWPKMLAAYFLVLALHFYLRWLRWSARSASGSLDSRSESTTLLACWVSGLLGFLTHQVAAVYLGVLVLHAALLLGRRWAWSRPRDLLLLPATALLLVGPWYAWLLVRFGVRNVLFSTPVTQMEERTTLPAYLAATNFNLFASVAPLDLGKALAASPRSGEDVYQGLTTVYFSLLPGALTLSLSLFLLAVLVRSLGRTPLLQQLAVLRRTEWSATWAFALLGASGAAALHPRIYSHGIAHAALFPSVVVLVALAWGRLSQGPRSWTTVACAGMVVEFGAMLWSHVWLMAWPTVLDPYPYNYRLKAEHHLLFLADALAPVRPAGIGVTVLVELVLVGLLVRWLCGPGAKAAERLQNDGKPL